MPKYTLNYFPTPGRAELARLLFAASGQEYTNNMYTKEDWEKIKGDAKRFPLHQMPTLEVDGETVVHSRAINRFLANEFGMNGTSNMETCQIDQVLETLDELYTWVLRIMYYNTEDSDETKKQKLCEKLASDEIQKKLEFIQEKFLKKNENGFLVGNKTTIADLAIFGANEGISRLYPDFLKNFPDLKNFCEKIGSDEKIKAYVSQRKY